MKTALLIILILENLVVRYDYMQVPTEIDPEPTMPTSPQIASRTTNVMAAEKAIAERRTSQKAVYLLTVFLLSSSAIVIIFIWI